MAIDSVTGQEAISIKNEELDAFQSFLVEAWTTEGTNPVDILALVNAHNPTAFRESHWAPNRSVSQRTGDDMPLGANQSFDHPMLFTGLIEGDGIGGYFFTQRAASGGARKRHPGVHNNSAVARGWRSLKMASGHMSDPRFNRRVLHARELAVKQGPDHEQDALFMTARALDDESIHPSQTMRLYLNYYVDEKTGNITDKPLGFEYARDTLGGMGTEFEEVRPKVLIRPGLPPLDYAQEVRRVVVAHARERIAKLIGV